MFNFRVVFDLQKNYKDSVESSHVPYTQFYYPLFTSYITTVHLQQLLKQYWYITINQSPYFIQLSWLYLISSFLLQDPI